MKTIIKYLFGYNFKVLIFLNNVLLNFEHVSFQMQLLSAVSLILFS